jgi:hypothetical protein
VQSPQINRCFPNIHTSPGLRAGCSGSGGARLTRGKSTRVTRRGVRFLAGSWRVDPPISDRPLLRSICTSSFARLRASGRMSGSDTESAAIRLSVANFFPSGVTIIMRRIRTLPSWPAIPGKLMPHGYGDHCLKAANSRRSRSAS